MGGHGTVRGVRATLQDVWHCAGKRGCCAAERGSVGGQCGGQGSVRGGGQGSVWGGGQGSVWRAGQCVGGGQCVCGGQGSVWQAGQGSVRGAQQRAGGRARWGGHSAGRVARCPTTQGTRAYLDSAIPSFICLCFLLSPHSAVLKGMTTGVRYFDQTCFHLPVVSPDNIT